MAKQTHKRRGDKEPTREFDVARSWADAMQKDSTILKAKLHGVTLPLFYKKSSFIYFYQFLILYISMKKLSVWAKETGISYQTAWLWFKRGILPVETIQLPTGTILVKEKLEK